jgi:hypothetical protein
MEPIHTTINLKKLIAIREEMILYCVKTERCLENNLIPKDVKEVIRETHDMVKAKIEYIEGLTIILPLDRISLR